MLWFFLVVYLNANLIFLLLCNKFVVSDHLLFLFYSIVRYLTSFIVLWAEVMKSHGVYHQRSCQGLYLPKDTAAPPGRALSYMLIFILWVFQKKIFLLHLFMLFYMFVLKSQLFRIKCFNHLHSDLAWIFLAWRAELIPKPS